MSRYRVFAMPRNEALAGKIARHLSSPEGKIELRAFPDGETHLKVESLGAGEAAIIVATLDRPDSKTLPLVLAAETLRDLGAKAVVLVAPYLAYMRQDRRFEPGEGVTSRYFAALLSRYFQGLVTVDPHLHRYGSLEEIYSIPCRVGHAGRQIAEWIRAWVENPLMVGPDRESAQWVAEVARKAGAPFLVLEKRRLSDREVEIDVPEVGKWKDHQPILVDDIISSGGTMLQVIGQLRKAGMKPPICVGTHAVFATGAYETLLAAGIAEIVTTDTIPHASNRIDLSETLAQETRILLEGLP